MVASRASSEKKVDCKCESPGEHLVVRAISGFVTVIPPSWSSPNYIWNGSSSGKRNLAGDCIMRFHSPQCVHIHTHTRAGDPHNTSLLSAETCHRVPINLLLLTTENSYHHNVWKVKLLLLLRGFFFCQEFSFLSPPREFDYGRIASHPSSCE